MTNDNLEVRFEAKKSKWRKIMIKIVIYSNSVDIDL